MRNPSIRNNSLWALMGVLVGASCSIILVSRSNTQIQHSNQQWTPRSLGYQALRRTVGLSLAGNEDRCWIVIHGAEDHGTVASIYYDKIEYRLWDTFGREVGHNPVYKMSASSRLDWISLGPGCDYMLPLGIEMEYGSLKDGPYSLAVTLHPAQGAEAKEAALWYGKQHLWGGPATTSNVLKMAVKEGRVRFGPEAPAHLGSRVWDSQDAGSCQGAMP
jgi:hypothetical protein